MAKVYKALVCCRAGVGSSAMLQKKCDKIIEAKNLPIETEHGSLQDLTKFDGDVVITMSDIAGIIDADPTVPSAISVFDIVDEKEIEEKLEAWLADHAE